MMSLPMSRGLDPHQSIMPSPTNHLPPGGDGPGAGNDVDGKNIGGRANNFGMDEFEFGIDEDLNTGWMGADRVHLDGDLFISDYDEFRMKGWVVNGWTSTQKLSSYRSTGQSVNNSYYVKRSSNG